MPTTVCDNCHCSTGYYFTGSRVPLSVSKDLSLCHLCEGAAVGAIYKTKVNDPATTGDVGARAIGPDVWFAGAEAAKLAQLERATSKVIQHHPTFTASRPCSGQYFAMQ